MSELLANDISDFFRGDGAFAVGTVLRKSFVDKRLIVRR
jgi:hypothetical protein